MNAKISTLVDHVYGHEIEPKIFKTWVNVLLSEHIVTQVTIQEEYSVWGKKRWISRNTMKGFMEKKELFFGLSKMDKVWVRNLKWSRQLRRKIRYEDFVDSSGKIWFKASHCKSVLLSLVQPFLNPQYL